MFKKNTQVVWATKSNTFMGKVIESNENISIVVVTSTAKGRKFDGKKVAVHNQYLADIATGKAIVTRI